MGPLTAKLWEGAILGSGGGGTCVCISVDLESCETDVGGC